MSPDSVVAYFNTVVPLVPLTIYKIILLKQIEIGRGCLIIHVRVRDMPPCTERKRAGNGAKRSFQGRLFGAGGTLCTGNRRDDTIA